MNKPRPKTKGMKICYYKSHGKHANLVYLVQIAEDPILVYRYKCIHTKKGTLTGTPKWLYPMMGDTSSLRSSWEVIRDLY